MIFEDKMNYAAELAASAIIATYQGCVIQAAHDKLCMAAKETVYGMPDCGSCVFQEACEAWMNALYNL